MTSAPRFELPPAPTSGRRPWWLIAPAMFAAGAMAGFLLAPREFPDSVVTSATSSTSAPEPDELLSGQDYRQLAERLERNQLFAQAAEAWEAAARLDPPRGAARADRLFRIGKNLSLAGRHDEALRYLFAAEAAGARESLQTSINSLVLEGLSALGLEHVRDYQVIKRSGLADSTAATQATDELARIGNEVVTERELKVFARRRVEKQLGPRRMLLSETEFREAVESALEQFESPEGRRRLVQMYLQDELLYREALAYNIPDRKDVRRAVTDARRQVLIDSFLNHYLHQAVQVDEAGIEDAYAANKSQYVEPQAVRVEAIVVEREEDMEKVSQALEKGEDFTALRERFSSETDPMVFSDQWFPRDGVVPGLRDSRVALAHLFALEPEEVSDRWFEGHDRWYRFRVLEHRPRRQLALAECRDRVERDLRRRKRQEAIETLQATLADKYNVSVPTPGPEPRPGEKTPDAHGKPTDGET